MTLIISRKEEMDTGAAKDSMRQIERWANQLKFNRFTLNANWSTAAGQIAPGWWLDPFGIVHFQGAATFSLAVSSGSVTQIVGTPLPPQIAPVQTGPLIFAVAAVVAATECDNFQVSSTLGIRFVPSSSATGCTVHFNGVTYNPKQM